MLPRNGFAAERSQATVLLSSGRQGVAQFGGARLSFRWDEATGAPSGHRDVPSSAAREDARKLSHCRAAGMVEFVWNGVESSAPVFYIVAHMQAQAGNLVRDGIVETFWADAKSHWDRFPNKGLFFGLLIPWLLLFQLLGNGTFGYIDTASLFKWMWVVHTQSADESEQGPGMLAPLLVAVLFWLKRKELAKLELKCWGPALALLMLGVGLHTLGYLIQQPRLSIIAFFTGLYAMMGMAWGPKFLRASFFPFFLFVFMIPLQSTGAVVTFPLRIMATMVVEFTSRNLLGFDVVRVGTGLFDSSYYLNPQGAYQYDVAPACSGLRSVTAMFFIATAYGYWLFQTSWRWLVFIAAAFPLAVIGNVVRLQLIVLAAELFGKDMGDKVHHSTLISLLPYIPVIFGLLWLAGWLEKRNPSVPKVKNNL